MKTQVEVISALSNNDNVLKTRVQSLEKLVEKYDNTNSNSESRKSKISFKCKECDLECDTEEAIEAHVDTEDDDDDDVESLSSMFECPVTTCVYKGTTEEELANHELTHVNSGSCPKCPYKDNKESRLLAHIENHAGGLRSSGSKSQEEATPNSVTEPPGSRPFDCTECGLIFATSDERETHINTIHRNTFSCNKCNYKCGRKDNLLLHMKTHEKVESSFSCSECDYEGTSKELYQAHILIHNVENPKNKSKQRPRSGSIKRKDSLPSTNVWGKLSLDDLARKHFIDSLVNNDGFTAPCRNGKPIKEKYVRKTVHLENTKKQTNKSGVVGTAKGSNLTVDDNERKYRGTVFATRYRANTNIAVVKSNLERNLLITTGEVHHVDVERLKPKFDSYSSFKITCVCNNTSVLMNSDIWPERSFVRWWRFPPKSNGGITGSSKN